MPRLVFAFFMLVSFGLQSYITQTHIHLDRTAVIGFGAELSNTALAKSIHDARGAPRPAQPADDEPGGCPFAQAMVHAGAFVSPCAIPLLLPQQTASTIPLAIAIPALVVAISHDWHGRAPPR